MSVVSVQTAVCFDTIIRTKSAESSVRSNIATITNSNIFIATFVRNEFLVVLFYARVRYSVRKSHQ